MQESLRYKNVSLPVRKVTRARRGGIGWFGSVSSRAAVVSFGLAELVAFGLRLRWARGAWFGVDDWDFLAARTGGNLGDLFRADFDHWATLIVLVYRLLWWSVGLSYLPYAVFAILLHLGAAALLRAVMRRAGVGPWVATAAASVFVFLGTGIENNFFTSAMVFGLTQLLLADHDGPVDRRDYLGLGAGLLGLLCSGLAVTMTVVVGVAMLLRRGWRIALFHTAPLAALYLIWLAAAPKGSSNGTVTSSPYAVAIFVVHGFRGGFARLGQLPGFGLLFAAILVGGLALYCAERGVAVLRGRAASSVALLGGATTFLILAGVTRAGIPAFFADSGPAASNTPAFNTPPLDIARQGRYTYVVAAMTLPALALATDAIIRRWHDVALLMAALLIVSYPGHIHSFRTDARTFAASASGSKQLILSVPRLPLAPQLPRNLKIGVFFHAGPSLGWLLDSLPSGRIPAPPSLTPDYIANETLDLALDASTDTQRKRCRTLTRPILRVLHKGDVLTLNSGLADITYLPATGGRSRVEPFPAPTVVALVGPLRLRLDPRPSLRAGKTVLCG